MLQRAKIVTLLHNLGEATGLIEDTVRDTAEFYEACTQLFELEHNFGIYMEMVELRNASAFVNRFIELHVKELREGGWLI